MDFLEKNLEDIIFESDKESLQKRGLWCYGKFKRQLRIGNYGIADLVLFERTFTESYHFDGILKPFLNITIFELKKDKIGISAFLQAIGYAKGIQEYLDEYKPELEYTLNITLIGSSIDTSGTFCFIPSLFSHSRQYECNSSFISNINCYSYQYKLDGMYFKSEDDYNLTDKGF